MVNFLTILIPFLSKPKEKIHLAQLSRETGIPHPTARLHLGTLEKKGLVKKEIIGRQTFFSLRTYISNLNYLVIAEKIKSINASKNLFLNELIEYLQTNFNGNILLFGSITNDFKKANDIDILTTSNITEEEISTKFNKPVQIIKVNSLRKVSETLKQEIIKKHLIIQGSEEFLKWMIWDKSNGV